MARRGCPANIYMDNGTNFVGARAEIKEIIQMTQSKDTLNGFSHLTSQNDLKWHHIPPRAPHFGGLWEEGVKSMKLLLRKTLTPHPLRYEELYTALVEVEAILNSRPLSPLHADDLKEVAFLTPGHFFIG